MNRRTRCCALHRVWLCAALPLWASIVPSCSRLTPSARLLESSLSRSSNSHGLSCLACGEARKLGKHIIWQEVIERFEEQAPEAGMAHLALEHALPASWIDWVLEAHQQRQYPRELLFSSVVELMLVVTLGLRPSLHAAARNLAQRLQILLAALYVKVQRIEPAVLRALLQASAERLIPLAQGLPVRASLPGWQLRVFDGNHLPASDKRLAPLRGLRGAVLTQ